MQSLKNRVIGLAALTAMAFGAGNAQADKLDDEVKRFCEILSSRPRPAILGLKEYLRSAPRMDAQGALDYARSLHSMVNTAAAMKH